MYTPDQAGTLTGAPCQKAIRTASVFPWHPTFGFWCPGAPSLPGKTSSSGTALCLAVPPFVVVVRVHAKDGHVLAVADTAHCTDGIEVEVVRSSDARIGVGEGGIAAETGAADPRGRGVAGSVVAGSESHCGCSAPRILVWANVRKILDLGRILVLVYILVLVTDSWGIPVLVGWVCGRCMVVQACRCPGTSLCAYTPISRFLGNIHTQPAQPDICHSGRAM